jgi:hypothetical protein
MAQPETATMWWIDYDGQVHAVEAQRSGRDNWTFTWKGASTR